MADETFLPETLLETPEAEEVEPELSKTEQMLAELLGKQHELNKRLIDDRIAPKGVPLQPESVAPDLKISLDGLPDPAYDLAGYIKGYTDRITEAAGKFARVVQDQAAGSAARAASDADIRARADAFVRQANPAYDDDIIALGATAVAKRYRDQGLNPMDVLRSRTDEVSQEIVDYIDGLSQKLGGGSGKTEGRTAGLLTPRARTPAAAKPETKPTNLVDDIRDFQKRARIY